MAVFDRRRSGLLLHLSSLPSPYGIGDLGKAAHRFLDLLQKAGQSLWQILPIHPTGIGNSPYSATSTFAGNPLFIDLDGLVAEGDLDQEDVVPWRLETHRTDYEHARRCRNALLPVAARRFFNARTSGRRRRYETFCASQAWWLDDYALFQTLRDTFDSSPWTEWPHPLRDREEAALQEWSTKLGPRIDELKYQQFIFFDQWKHLRSEAASRGILLFGDVPFYVAHDSADVWSNRDLFRLDDAGRPTAVAGVPPDYFSETGQLWGNPVYDWPKHLEQGFRWWRARMRWVLDLFDLVRVDHFRALSASWVIPANAPDARHGQWERSPGEDLLKAWCQDIGNLPLVAEDLGVITEDVTLMRRRWQLPGMRILQFAFDSGPDNPYLPHNHTIDSVIYTGTHDNDTCSGWWNKLEPEQKDQVRHYLDAENETVCQQMIRQALASVGIFCILPVQDLLELGSEARMNQPGTSAGNWSWRLPQEAASEKLARELHRLTEAYGRIPATGASCPQA